MDLEPAELHGPATATAHDLDLDAIDRDLAGVEIALERLDAGTYWTCEVTGAQLPDDLLRDDPTARRLPTAVGSASSPEG